MPIGAAWPGSPVPAPPPARRWATTRRYSPATSWPSSTQAADLLPPVAMWTAFPPSDYYEGSAPPGDHQPTTSLPAPSLAGWEGGRPLGGSHVHHATGRRDRRPAIPRQPRHEYAAALPRGLHVGRTIANPGVALPSGSKACTADRPRSTRFRAGGVAFGGSTTGSCTRTPLRLACRARAVWRYRLVPSSSGLLPALPGASQVRLPPASPGCCDSPAAESFHLRPVSWRLVAHPLDLPAVAPKPRRRLDLPPSDPRLDPTAP